MPGLQDDHLEALRQTEERFPDLVPTEPPRFRTRQAVVLAIVVGLLLLAFVAYVVFR